MILAVDIGNTTVRFCSVSRQGAEFQVENSIRYPTDGFAFPYFADAGLSPDLFEGAVISSVVPSRTALLTDLLSDAMGKPPLVVTSETDFHMPCAVKHPDRLGTDRLVDACYAKMVYPLPLITVDAGTAVTLNAVDRDGRFLGGAIAPGLELAMGSLHEHTAQLSSEVLSAPEHVIGTDTRECMLSGVVAGTAGLVEGLVRRMSEEMGEGTSVVLTGGGSRYFMPFLTIPYHYEPDLQMKGLAMLYLWNGTSEGQKE